MSEALLKVEHLTMRFGGLTAIADLDLVVAEHSIHSVIGPNGAGFVVMHKRYPVPGAQSRRLTAGLLRNPANHPGPRSVMIKGPGGQRDPGTGGMFSPGSGGILGHPSGPAESGRRGLGVLRSAAFTKGIVRQGLNVTRPRWGGLRDPGGPECAGARSPRSWKRCGACGRTSWAFSWACCTARRC